MKVGLNTWTRARSCIVGTRVRGASQERCERNLIVLARLLKKRQNGWEHLMTFPFSLTCTNTDLARQVFGEISLQSGQTAQRDLHHCKEGTASSPVRCNFLGRSSPLCMTYTTPWDITAVDDILCDCILATTPAALHADLGSSSLKTTSPASTAGAMLVTRLSAGVWVEMGVGVG